MSLDDNQCFNHKGFRLYFCNKVEFSKNFVDGSTSLLKGICTNSIPNKF